VPSKSITRDIAAWGNRLSIFLNVVLFVLAGWFITTRGLQPAPNGFTYQDLVTVLLTAIAVILAAVTVFVALVALWGYNALKENAKSAAEAAARETAEETARVTAKAAARTLTMRELPGMVELYFRTHGVPEGSPEAVTEGAEVAGDDLSEALKRGDGDEEHG